jgi:hypothetical protein
LIVAPVSPIALSVAGCSKSVAGNNHHQTQGSPMGSLPLADAVERSSARPTELRTKIDLPLGDSLSRYPTVATVKQLV